MRCACALGVATLLSQIIVIAVVSLFFFFKQKTAYEMRISDWSSDVCSSDLSTEWDGPAFDAAQFPDDAPLMLYAHEVAWGRLDEIGRASCRERVCQYV